MQRIILIFIRAMLAALVLFVVVFPAWGGEKAGSSKTPASTPEWTEHNESDPGMAKEKPAR